MRSLAAQVVRQLPNALGVRLDGELLSGFLTHGAEDDFAELVRRHGPLVWGVCRRALPDQADAEDAFQATFLVLLRRGRKLTGYPTIGPWLHKVAAWTARNVRRRNARRLARQTALPDQLPATVADKDLPLDIDAALLTLPEKFRSPIVLCHLLGDSAGSTPRNRLPGRPSPSRPFSQVQWSAPRWARAWRPPRRQPCPRPSPRSSKE